MSEILYRLALGVGNLVLGGIMAFLLCYLSIKFWEKVFGKIFDN